MMKRCIGYYSLINQKKSNVWPKSAKFVIVALLLVTAAPTPILLAVAV